MKQVSRLTVLALACSVTLSADDSRNAFVRSWQGRTVVVRQTMYTLVYNERGKLGRTHNDRRDGLTVVTPLAGSYLQFDGRQSQDDIVDQDPQRLVDAVKAAYRSDALDVREYQKIEPVLLTRYEVGVELVVSEVKFDRHVVKLVLMDPRSRDLNGEPATVLTVRWPTPLSPSLSERPGIERAMAQFVEVKTVQP